MATTKDVPVFGNLQGLKVFSSGSVVASPFTAALFAENGATVIHAESSLSPDTCRAIKYAWNQEHRNELTIAMNTAAPEGLEIFKKFIAWADIWCESSKGGTYAKWGLTDEVLWSINPKLVIVHVCGFGQKGVPEYVNRASYDAIGQAFGGYMFLNGFPEPMPPTRAVPYTCDYVTALFGCWTGLMAYIRAQKTGKGESIDLAQFEVMAKITLHYPMTWFMDKKVLTRMGNADPKFACYNAYKCQDGNYVFIGLVGAGPLKKGLALLGIKQGEDPLFPAGMPLALAGSPAGIKLEEAVTNFCLAHSAVDVDRLFMENGVPCSTIATFEIAENNPHYIAREVWAEWEDPQYGHVKGLNVQPRCAVNPGKIWRGAPLFGQDNSDLLKEFGYTQAEVDELYAKGVLKAGEGCH